MTFALSVIKLEEALSKPGCPVCRISHEAAEHSLRQFLWENSNDPALGAQIRAAYGFCPDHTQMLVAVELATDGNVLAVNQVFSRLAKWTAADLSRFSKSPQPLKSFQRLVGKLGARITMRPPEGPLTAKGNCPTCQVVEKSAYNTLTTLFEELEDNKDHFAALYKSSDGLCLEHLRGGISYFQQRFPDGTDTLVSETVRRLEKWRTNMLEFIRKQNWEYQQEPLTEEEKTAWREVVTFFSGFPGERFTHKIKKF